MFIYQAHFSPLLWESELWLAVSWLQATDLSDWLKVFHASLSFMSVRTPSSASGWENDCDGNTLTHIQSENASVVIQQVGITMSELWRLSFCLSGLLSLAIVISSSVSHQMSPDLIHPPQTRSKAQRHRHQTSSTRTRIDVKGWVSVSSVHLKRRRWCVCDTEDRRLNMNENMWPRN